MLTPSLTDEPEFLIDAAPGARQALTDWQADVDRTSDLRAALVADVKAKKARLDAMLVWTGKVETPEYRRVLRATIDPDDHTDAVRALRAAKAALAEVDDALNARARAFGTAMRGLDGEGRKIAAAREFTDAHGAAVAAAEALSAALVRRYRAEGELDTPLSTRHVGDYMPPVIHDALFVVRDGRLPAWAARRAEGASPEEAAEAEQEFRRTREHAQQLRAVPKVRATAERPLGAGTEIRRVGAR